MTQKFTRSRTTWVAYILLALYAYFINIPGPITPFLRDEFKFSYTVSSLHFSAFAAGILVIGFTGHLVIRRTGRRLALSIGALGLGGGALLLALGANPLVTIVAIFLIFAVGWVILAVVPPAISEEHGELRAVAISEANTLSSLVAALAPLMVGWFAGLQIGSIVFGWRWALILAAALSLLIGATLFKPGAAGGVQSRAGQTRGRLPLLFWFYWACLALAVSIEFCMVLWSANFIESEVGLPRASAAQAVSLFLGGMIVGRLVGSRLLHNSSPRRVVLVSLLLGMLGFALYWSAAGAWLALSGLALTGLGVASLYPSILSLAIGSAPENEEQAGARTTLASGAAILLLPLLLGRLADITGLKDAFLVVAGLFVVLFLMILVNNPQKTKAAHE